MVKNLINIYEKREIDLKKKNKKFDLKIVKQISDEKGDKHPIYRWKCIGCGEKLQYPIRNTSTNLYEWNSKVYHWIRRTCQTKSKIYPQGCRFPQGFCTTCGKLFRRINKYNKNCTECIVTLRKSELPRRYYALKARYDSGKLLTEGEEQWLVEQENKLSKVMKGLAGKE